MAATRTDDDQAPPEVSDSDLRKEMESEGHNNHLGLGSSTQKKSKARLSSDVLTVGESRSFRFSGSSNKPLTIQKELSYENHEHSKYPKSGKQLTFDKDNRSQEFDISRKDVGAFLKVKTSESQNELHTDAEAHFCNSEIMEAETTSRFCLAGKSVATAFPVGGRLGEETSKQEINQIDKHSGDDKQRIASRLAAPAIRGRSLLPGVETKDGNKCPVAVCDFFTKGWCIKGNSCKFLHAKDDTNNTRLQPEQDLAAASVKTEFHIDEGLSNITDRARLSCFPDPPGSSVNNYASSSPDLSSERILPQELGENKRLSQFQDNHRSLLLQSENISLCPPSSQRLASSRDDVGVISSFKDVGRETVRKNCSADDYHNHASLLNGGSSPIFRNSLPHEHRSSLTQYICNNYPSLSHPMDSSLSTSGLIGGSLPPHHILAWTGSSLPYNSSSSNANPLGAQKLLDSDRQCRTSASSSLLRSSSPFWGSELERPLLSVDYKTKVSSNDWEPSVPFRPSFFIDFTNISSPGSQYDPLRDSFDSPKIGDVSLKNSFSSVRASTINMPHQQIYGDSMLSRTIVSECISDKSFVSSHDRFHENVLDKDSQTPGKDSHKAREEEVVGTSTIDVQSGTMLKEDPSVSTYVEDISKPKKINTNRDSRHQNYGSRCVKDLKGDRVKQNNEMDSYHKTDGGVRKESRVMRHFRAGLVDFVKELLKPTWREGKLSKDAHNRIVKKAVDKVLSALQPHQIPTKMESVKQYLSSSQPKIAKLIEGYVDKYGKS